MRRSLPILAAVLSSLLWVGCQEQVPAVTCTWDLPAADTARVPGLAGFNLLIEVSGSFDSTSLPAVHFFSDLEASNPDYPEGLILEAAIAVDETAGCAEGCAAGARIETPLTSGMHWIVARALTPSGATACEASSTVTVNAVPTVTSITFSPETPEAGQDIDLVVEITDTDDSSEDVSWSAVWTGPEDQTVVDTRLTGHQTTAGDEWTVAVTPRDPFDTGNAVSETVTVANTAPSAPTVSISPSPARVNAELGCAVTDLDELDDDEGQTLSVSWSWTRGGDDAGITEDTVPAASLNEGDVWVCTAIVSDGSDSSEGGSATSTVAAVLTAPPSANLSAHTLITGVRVNQYFGDVDQVGSPGDINGDGLADIVLAANDEVCGATSCDGQGAALLISGADSLSPTSATSTARFLPAAGILVTAPKRIGDLNADGIDDLVLPFRSATLPLQPSGNGVYLVFGTAGGFTGDIDLNDTDSTYSISRIVGISQKIGQVPCPVGDLDGDGDDELVLVAPEADLGKGVVYVIYGHPGAWLSGVDPGSLSPSFSIEGGAEGHAMGQSCAGPLDLNDDGFLDIVLSAPGGGTGSGRVLIFFGDGTEWAGTQGSATADILIDGVPVVDHESTSHDGNFGVGLAALGDHDGDGVDDFAAYGLGPITDDGDGGTVWIVSGGLLPTDLPASFDNDESTTESPAVDPHPLYTIAGAGDLGFCGHPIGLDLDGDGLGDLACGDIRPQTAEDLSLSAGIRVFYGASDLPVTRSYSDAGSVFSSASVDDRPGVALGRVADRDGNSYEELLVGLPGYDGGLTDTGAISVVDLSSN